MTTDGAADRIRSDEEMVAEAHRQTETLAAEADRYQAEAEHEPARTDLADQADQAEEPTMAISAAELLADDEA